MYYGRRSGEKICGTFLALSDAAGDLTGSYIDANGTIHGYLRPAATGVSTSFDDPNAYTSGSLNGTLGVAINSQTSGIEITGSYIDANSVLHGFSYTPSLTTTTTTLTPVPSPNPSVYQEPVTLTASVSSSGGTPANGENVTFMSGATSLGTAQLTSGTASLTTMALPVGTDSITAVYGGDSAFASSTSAAVNQTVNKASSSTALTSSLNPANAGQSVTLTANVSGQFSGVATGTVAFSNGNSSLGNSAVSSNMATLITAALPVGTDSITAVYSGDSNFAGSTSSTLSQVVNALPQAATPTFLPVAGTYTSAQSVTISDATSGTTIYYTTNGTTPTTGSTVFSSSSPIAVSSSETIEAIAAAPGYSNSAVASAAYTINLPGFAAPSGSQPGSISIQPGASTGNTATISVVGTNGFSGTVNLTCSIAPVAAIDPPTCTLSPSSVTLSGTTTQTSTLTVTTTAATSDLIQPAWRPAAGTALAVILMLAIPRRRRSWLAMLVLLAIAVCGTFVGCGGKSGGGGGNSGTSAGTYTVTVTGTSGAQSATITTVSLTVK
ncbi:MAG: Ig-like domain-containing protein [Terracidiphilus sp.]